jgi:protein-tyrosine phosphatase
MPSDGQRRITLPGALNLRDLGGYPTTDGGVLRWRTLLRSDALSGLDAAGRAELARIGLRTVVDLRTSEEARHAPSILDGPGTQVFQVPVFTAGAIGHLTPTLAAVYEYMVDECGQAITAAVRYLCADGALPGLVHCSAGKDRTGLVVAVILGALGVPDDVIAADYALSAGYIGEGASGVLGRLKAIGGLAHRLDLGVLGSPPGLIASALARMRAQAGSVAGYLARHGLAEGDLQVLRASLVTYPG